MAHVMAPPAERSGHTAPSESRDAERPTSLSSERGDRQTALRVLSQRLNSPASKTLPALATANDIREAVQILKRKLAGVSMVEAMDAVKKRVFEPRKVNAYEFWGIVHRNGDRLKLSPLGWELARKLEPEAQIYRLILNSTPAYRSVIEWVHQQNVDLITHTDVAAYWGAHHPEVIEQGNEKIIEGSVVSFFHLCQAAELGTMTIGKRGQPARLRIEHDEVLAFIEGKSLSFQEEAPTGDTTKKRKGQNTSPSLLADSPAKLRVFISRGKNTKIIDQVQEALELAAIESEVATRIDNDGVPIPTNVLQTMRQCDAGVIVITSEDCQDESGEEFTLNEQVLIEIGAALAFYNDRVVLLRDKRIQLPAILKDIRSCKFDGNDLTWDAGMQLMKTIVDLKNTAERSS